MTDREKQIRAKVDGLLAELRALAESDPDRLHAVDFMILAIHSAAAVAASGRAVVLTPAQVSILADGAVQLLSDWAASDLDAEAARQQAVLAAMPRPATMH